MNIVLIGMSGVGKSTLGVLLAKALGMEFVDTDILIQNNEGLLLQEIINTKGISYFLKVEEKAILNLQIENCVIATGGSVIYSAKSMEFLKNNGCVIFLHLPYEEIEKRITNITTRGIVIKPGSKLIDVYNERLPLYIKYSDNTIDCMGLSVEDCVYLILNSLK